MRIDAARARVDLARAEAPGSDGPHPTLDAAQRILEECHAGAFLHEVDEALAATPP
ncbi:MAG: hypothetical protein KatS3mg014_1049 [Actinomycetota bacterium]|nr:MAG: hypothetical protein KatS3mg014_1049 [Actinomycetota bacterium]